MDDPSDQSAPSACIVSLHVPGSYRYLTLVRETVLELAQKQGFNMFQAGEIEMAVDEVCINVIEHSYGGECPLQSESDHPGLTVRFLRLKDGMAVEISDFGTGFDFKQDQIIRPEQVVEGKNERGLGLYIVSQFVDDIHYERGSDSSNTTRLTKQL